MADDFREKILTLLKTKGPLVPNDIKKVLKGDTLIFGAILSELASRGMVKITDLKKGSSPFYYIQGHEHKLDNLIEFLNAKDQVTARYLKEQKVIQDKNLDLLQRVSLRKIKDFAKEMNVSTSAGQLLFWRYHTTNEQDAMQILKHRYNKPPKQSIKKEISPVKKEIEQILKPTNNQEESKPAEIKSNTTIAKKIDSKTTNEELKKVEVNQKEKLDEKKSFENKPKTNYNQKQITATPNLEKTPFYNSVWEYFKEQGIDVIEETMISKNREYEFIIVVPSAIGTINYYCRARNKKKLNEGDVAPALLKAKQKDLQCLFLTNGDFTKKSLVLINKEYSGIIIKTF